MTIPELFHLILGALILWAILRMAIDNTPDTTPLKYVNCRCSHPRYDHKGDGHCSYRDFTDMTDSTFGRKCACTVFVPDLEGQDNGV